MKKLLLLSIVFFSLSLNSRNDLTISSFKSSPNTELVCTINCPDDILITLDPGACEMEILYTVSSTMCSGSIVQTSGLPSGSIFQIGTTTNCFQIQSATCCFDVTVIEYPTPTTTLACNDNVQVSVNENCEAFIETDMILEGGPYSCYNDYIVSVQGYGSGFGGVTVNSDAVGQTLSVTVTDPETGNFCWGTISVEDKVLPIITCPPTVNFAGCNMTHPNITGNATAIDNCTNTPLITYSDENFTDLCPGLGSGIFRTWKATDESGNYAECVQQIGERCQAHHIFINDVTSTSISLEWTNGNGDYRIVEISTSSAFYLPVNGLTYSFETEYQGSNQQIVYVGTGDNVTVTKLEPNKTYWFHVYEAYCYESSPTYYLIDEVANPKSKATLSGSHPSDNIPGEIISPVKWVGSPGAYQSKLPDDLFNAIPGEPFTCDKKYCDEILWRSNGVDWNSHLDKQGPSSCEVLPKAVDCYDYNNNDLTLEFRQRGHITGSGSGSGCNACDLLNCSGDPWMPGQTVSHGENGCDSRDDRRSWDMNLINGDSEVGANVFAVEEGIIDDITNQNSKDKKYYGIRIKHGTQNPWYSWYIFVNRVTGIEKGKPVKKNQLIGKIGVPKGIDPHMHFGVFYLSNGKYISVDRPIKRNPEGRFMSNNNSEFTNFNIKLANTNVASAQIFKQMDSIWVELEAVDETGRLSLTTLPGIIQGDSIKVIAPGFLPVGCLFDTLQNKLYDFNVVLFTSELNNNLSGCTFEATNKSTFYDIPSIEIKVQGNNYSNFDVFEYIDFDEGPKYNLLSSGHIPSDTILNINLTRLDENFITIRFNGIDTQYVFKKFIFYPSYENISFVNLKVDSFLNNSSLYIDGQYFRNINEDTTLEFPPGDFKLHFTKPGYIDTIYYINGSETINLSMAANKFSYYSNLDSSFMDFQHSNILYWRNSTLFDTSEQYNVIEKQYLKDYNLLGLTSLSRTFMFENANNTIGNTLQAKFVLDQPRSLSKSELYLARIWDNETIGKLFWESKPDLFYYDSAAQVIEYNDLAFNLGQNEVEEIFLAKKQPAIKKSSSMLIMEDGGIIKSSAYNFFSDPDSLKNDIKFGFEENDNIYITQTQDSFYFTANKCYIGQLPIYISAKHDELMTWDTIIIDIIPKEVPAITLLGDNFICAGESVGIIVNTDDSVQWNTGDTTSLILAQQGGSYFAIITDGNGCMDTTQTIIVEEIPIFQPTIYGNTGGICLGDTLTLYTDEFNQYLWNTGDTNQQIFITSGGEYSMTAVDTNGCSGVSETINIVLWSLPTIDLGQDTIVSGNEYVLNAGSNSENYSWSTGDTTQIITVTTLGEYSVTITDSNGCQASDTVIVDFNTGTSFSNELIGILVYPNPNFGVFHLECTLNNPGKLDIEIYDPMGRLIVSNLVESTAGSFNTILSIPNAHSGVYFLKLSFGSNSHIIKLIVL